MEIQPLGAKEDFLDGVMRHNNPMKLLMKVASKLSVIKVQWHAYSVLELISQNSKNQGYGKGGADRGD